MNDCKKIVLAIVMLLLAGAQSGRAAEADEFPALEHQFRALPIEARQLTGPLFWLHGDESAEQLTGELEKVRDGGNGTFTAESRPHVDWLGEGWYRDLGVCLDFARANRMSMWIFDEKWWPSGEVGGMVPQEYGCKSLVADTRSVSGPGGVELAIPAEHLIAVIAGRDADGGIDGESLLDLTDHITDGRLSWDAPSGKWRVMTFTWEYSYGPPGHRILVDGLSRDAVDWYLRTVYQPHYDRFAADFGTTIKGYFYDEPETPGDWGTEVLPMLRERGVDWKKALVAWKFRLAGGEQAAAKYQYQDAKAEAWGRTLYGGLTQWCHERGVLSMGHFLEHERLYASQAKCAGNMFQLQKYSDMGAIDIVYRQLPPGKRLTGTYQTPKLGSSISHVYGKKDDLTMVEIFGARGQDLTYPEMKWDLDQVQVRGVNFIIPHSFNPRAPHDRDCPPYFYNGGREPRYPLYRVFADYSSRLTLMLTGGRHVAPVALLYMGNSRHVGRATPPEAMTTALQDALYDCDWLPYDVFEREAAVEGAVIKLYGERYRVLVVPPVEAIPEQTLAKALAFFEAGGVVVGYGFRPSQSATLGKTSRDIADLTEQIWGAAGAPGLAVKKTSAAGGRSYFLPERPTPEQLQRVLADDAGIHPTLEAVAGKTDHWLHVLHRVKDGHDVFFVANQNLAGGPRDFTFRVTAPGEPECWDALRNEITRPAYRRLSPDQVEVNLSLEPLESVLLVFNQNPLNNSPRPLPPRLDPTAKPARVIPLTRDRSADQRPDPASKFRDTLALLRSRLPGQPPLTLSPVSANPFTGSALIPPDLDLARARVYLSCDAISPEPAARVTVNGSFAGGFIGPPLRLDITFLLHPGPNPINIEPFAPRQVRLLVYAQ
jgi:hypothetical protein